MLQPPSSSARPGAVPGLRIAHLVNVFVPPPGSEFEWVLPITLSTMRLARVATVTPVQVELLTAQFASDRSTVPPDFQPTPDLTRSVRDVWADPSLPPFPLMGDLLERLYHATDAEWLIYSNSDIALQPRFYDAVAGFIRAGHDAFVINRRRIPGHYRDVAQLKAMYAEKGKPHPGFDCFVIHRDLVPRFVLGKVCVGIPFVEILMGQNMFCHARNFKLFDREHLTFHIGEEVFKKRNPFLWQRNREEFWKAVEELWPVLDSRKFPWGRQWFPVRLVKWGLHPCIPIRLCLRLEMRKRQK
jgi:hypothetical protein